MPRLKREEVAKRHQLIEKYLKEGKTEKEAIEAIKQETGMAMAPNTVHEIWLKVQREMSINNGLNQSANGEVKDLGTFKQHVPESALLHRPKSRLLAQNCFKGSLYKIVDGGKKGTFVEIRTSKDNSYCVFDAGSGMEFAVDMDEEVIFIA